MTAAAIIDISKRRRLEEQLQQSRRLEALGQLAGGVAHDFNNVLLVVRGYAALLVEKLRGTEDEGDAQQIVAAADRAAGLTRQLLVFGRRQTLEPQILSVNEVVRGAEMLLQRLLPEDVELIVLPSADPAVVRADLTQVEQVLVNLVANARDAMRSGGAITIAVETVVVRQPDLLSQPHLKPGRYVAIRVSDTGPGIDRDVLEHIFEPFYTTKASDEGAGLGLATVHGIVVQNGGAVSVESVPGAGTTFAVYLVAAADSPKDEQETADDIAGGFGSERVLVVEDQPAARVLLERILRERGYDVVAAARPSEALRLSAEQPDEIDLLVSDVVMPEMSGYELAEALVADQPRMRNLFVSGYARGLRTVGGKFDAGIALLQKPFSPPELLRAIREVLDANPADEPGSP